MRGRSTSSLQLKLHQLHRAKPTRRQPPYRFLTTFRLLNSMGSSTLWGACLRRRGSAGEDVFLCLEPTSCRTSSLGLKARCDTIHLLCSLFLSLPLSLFFLLSVSFLLSALSHSIAMFCVCVFPASLSLSLSLSLSFSPLNFTFYMLLLLTFVFHNFAGRSRVGRH